MQLRPLLSLAARAGSWGSSGSLGRHGAAKEGTCHNGSKEMRLTFETRELLRDYIA
jgi:hypothetical protein